VPADTYPNLQAGLAEWGHHGPILETVTVGSSLFVAKRWARRHPQEYRLLLDAVSQTRAELLKPFEVRRAVRPQIDGLRKAGLPE
jgi:hypothetical protein